MNHIRPSQPTSPKPDSAILTPVYWSSLFLWSVSEPTFFPVKVQIHFPCTSSLKQEALRLSGLHPGLPAREQSAEVLWVHGLLDEQVDLPPHAEHRPLLHPLQLLLQPQQHPRRHFVEALAVTAGARAKGDETGLRQRQRTVVQHQQQAHLRRIPGFTAAVYVISPHSGAECGVELLLFVVLQVEGLQGVHGPVEQRIIQQHLYRGIHRGDA